jgi:hypothetical protein
MSVTAYQSTQLNIPKDPTFKVIMGYKTNKHSPYYSSKHFHLTFSCSQSTVQFKCPLQAFSNSDEKDVDIYWGRVVPFVC